jgi:hypothetical protein
VTPTPADVAKAALRSTATSAEIAAATSGAAAERKRLLAIVKAQLDRWPSSSDAAGACRGVLAEVGKP